MTRDTVMAAAQTLPLISDEALWAQIEPKHDKKSVVIHVDSGNYAMGRIFSQVKRTMLPLPSVARVIVRSAAPSSLVMLVSRGQAQPAAARTFELPP